MDAINKLRQIVAQLRSPDGCPWDREQSHQSLARCLIEECSELLEAIDEQDVTLMREELGDVLLQVLMHAQIAEEAGRFDLEAVIEAVSAKLIRRHPHVFDKEASPALDAQAALDQWEAVKAREKQESPTNSLSPFKDLPPQLPALLFALDVYKQIVKKELPYTAEDSLVTLDKNPDFTEERVGAALFELAAACYKAKIDPESALRRYTQKVMQSLEG